MLLKIQYALERTIGKAFLHISMYITFIETSYTMHTTTYCFELSTSFPKAKKTHPTAI